MPLIKKHLAVCSIPKCKQQISDNCSLHVFPNERDPRRKQWIRILKVEKDVPRHYRICSKHFKQSDFFPRHQMQKKLMLRPSAVPTENLPPEITDKDYIERPDSPYQPDNSSNSYVSLDQSDSSIIPINDYNDEQSMVVSDNLSNHFNYHSTNNSFTSTPTIASSAIINIQPTISYEQVDNLTALSTVPYQEITETSYSLYDGTEIDRRTLASVLNKDDYQENGQTITYIVNYVDY